MFTLCIYPNTFNLEENAFSNETQEKIKVLYKDTVTYRIGFSLYITKDKIRFTFTRVWDNLKEFQS